MKQMTYLSKLTFILMTGLLTLSSPQVHAVETFYIADIEAVRSFNRDGRPPRISVELTDTAEVPAFEGQEFRAANPSRREMLATLLTAVSNGFQVEVLVESDELGVRDRPLIRELILVVPAPAP